MSILDKLKNLFGGGGKPGRKPAKRPGGGKSYAAPTNRAETIAEAMKIHREGRAQVKAQLDATLKSLTDSVPQALGDPVALNRLLTLSRAHKGLKQMMASDNKRFLVLSGVRELLGPLVPKKPGPHKPKP